MSSELVAALVGAVAALSAVFAQNILSRSYSANDRRRELLIAAYEDYLGGLTLLSSVSEDDKKLGRQRLATGKGKIAAYAPSSVVRVVAEMEETSRQTSNADSQKAIVAIVLEMRKSVGVGHEGLGQEILRMLFGK